MFTIIFQRDCTLHHSPLYLRFSYAGQLGEGASLSSPWILVLVDCFSGYFSALAVHKGVHWLSDTNDTFVGMFHQFPTWKESFRLWKCQIPLCRVASFPSVTSPVCPKMALLPNDYYHLVTCPKVVTISDNQCTYYITFTLPQHSYISVLLHTFSPSQSTSA